MSRHGPKNYIRRPDMVKRIGSYLGTSFPLFHGPVSPVQHVSEELVSVLLLVTPEPRHHFPDRLEQTLRRDACILLITLQK